MNAIQWIAIGSVAGAFAVFLGLKQMNSVTEETARRYLAQGAKVVDVRSAEEFRERHLPTAINIPLDHLKERIVHEVPDKNTVLLLHCRSGGRSAIGMQQLNGLGYKNVFNLGSFETAAKLFAKGGK
jgi:phage shock protein E